MTNIQRQFTWFSFARILWFYGLLYAMLNVIKLATSPDTVDIIGAVVSLGIVCAAFAYLTRSMIHTKYREPEIRKELPYA